MIQSDKSAEFYAIKEIIDNLPQEKLGNIILGFPAYGGYIKQVEGWYKLMKVNFSAFWGEIGPLGREDLVLYAKKIIKDQN